MAAWRERALTGAVMVVVAVPLGIAIGGGLHLGGSEEVPLVAPSTTAVAGTPASTATTDQVRPVPTTASTGTTTTTSTTTTAPGRAPAQVKVRFYNGSRTAGAAVTVGGRLRALGYDVLPPGPSTADPVPATVIAHREGYAAEAAAVARALGVDPASVTPMPPRPNVPGTGDAAVVVIVAEDVAAGA